MAEEGGKGGLQEHGVGNLNTENGNHPPTAYKDYYYNVRYISIDPTIYSLVGPYQNGREGRGDDRKME